MSMGEGRCLATSASSSPPQSNGSESRPSDVSSQCSPCQGKLGLERPRSTPHMMMRGSGTDSPIDLWGSTLAPLR